MSLLSSMEELCMGGKPEGYPKQLRQRSKRVAAKPKGVRSEGRERDGDAGTPNA